MRIAWPSAIPNFRCSASSVARNFPICRSVNATSKNRNKTALPAASKMKVAVLGCAHGELDAIYAAVREIEQVNSTKVDLIVCAGDFQAVRNADDLACMACPPKFRDMRSFWKYHSGQSVAHVPTIFVGGNHEASNHLQELPVGGLVAPNMYFLGNAGVINYRGLRIAGISGVYTAHNYEKPRSEVPPYPGNQMKSVYHARKEDVDRLLRIRKPVDIFISHDWPRGIWNHGDRDEFLSAKPFLRSEVDRNTFGNPGTALILEQLQPSYWFSAHIHVKFPALVKHAGSGKETKFLALDKVLPRRDFIQLLDIPVPSQADIDIPSDSVIDPTSAEEHCINLDSEWLTILRTERIEDKCNAPVTDEDINDTMQELQKRSFKAIVHPVSDFERFGRTHNVKGPVRGRVPEALTLQPRSHQLLEGLGLLSED